MLTINGRVRLMRVRWRCAQEGGATPTDRLLDQAEATISEGGREVAFRTNQDASRFQKASANLERTAPIRTSKESLRPLVEARGQAVLRQLHQGALQPI